MSAIVRTKILALVVGTVGMGVISQLANTSALVFSFLPVGNLGLLRYISEFYEKRRMREINYLMRFFFLQNLFFIVIVGLLLALYSREISKLVFSNDIFSYAILIFSVSLPFALAGSFVDIYLRGLRTIKQYVEYNVFSSLLMLAMYIGLPIAFGLEGAVVAFSLYGLISTLVGIRVVKGLRLFPSFSATSKVEKDVVKNIYKIGIASMIMAIGQQFTFLSSKSVVAYELGLHEVGLYQSVFAVSNNYFGLFFTIVGAYSIPKLSSIKDFSGTSNEINNTLKLLILIFTPLIIISFVFRDFVLILLYSKDFIQARDLFFFQLPGDFMKALSWALGLWLVPYLRIKEWLMFDLIFDMVFLAVFYYLIMIQDCGIRSLSIAYFLAYAVHLVINFVYIRHSLRFKIENRVLQILLLSSFSIVTVFAVSYYYEYAGYVVLLPVLVTWLLLSVRKNEFHQIWGLLTGALTKGIRRV